MGPVITGSFEKRAPALGVLLREMSPYRESNKGGKEGQGPTLGVRLIKGVR